MVIPDFQTERLSVRNWHKDLKSQNGLLDELSSVLTPAVLDPLPPSMQMPEGGIADWARALLADAQCLVVRQDGQLVGLLILADAGDTEKPTLHVGYLFAEQVWGRGYASELLTGLVATVSRSGPMRLVAGVAKDNPASARVLVKAGFAPDRDRSATETLMFTKDVPN